MRLSSLLIRPAPVARWCRACLVAVAVSSLGSAAGEVETLRFDWTDATRDRVVPVKIYLPQGATGSCPVILFSHGLGGSREGYEYLGRHWATQGYVSVHLQHPGSDDRVWRDQPLAQRKQSMQQAANFENSRERPRDVSFVLDQLTELNQSDSPLRGRLDLDRVGMAGHSFGAQTTLSVAGQTFPLRPAHERNLGDPRIKAAIPMSAPVPARTDLDTAFGSIRIPCFHLTGTLDDSPIGDTQAEQRREPFDHSQHCERSLVIFEGGDHMIFSGRTRWQGNGARDAVFHDLIQQSTTAFWNAYLRDDPQAKAWLAQGGFKQALGTNGTFEVQRPK